MSECFRDVMCIEQVGPGGVGGSGTSRLRGWTKLRGQRYVGLGTRRKREDLELT